MKCIFSTLKKKKKITVTLNALNEKSVALTFVFSRSLDDRIIGGNVR